jgi:hypothetical protein
MSNNRKHLVRFLSLTLASFLSIAAYLVTVEPSGDKPLFTGNEKHQITTEMALTYVANYKSMEGEQLTAAYFGRSIFGEILAQDNAVGIRIYNARHGDGSPTFVIVGVDGQGNDLLGGVIAQQPITCPPFCANGALSLNQSRPVALN